MNVEVHTRKVLEAVLGVLHAFVLVHSGSLSGLMVVVMGGDFAVSWLGGRGEQAPLGLPYEDINPIHKGSTLMT